MKNAELGIMIHCRRFGACLAGMSLAMAAPLLSATPSRDAPPGHYSVSWLGNSFSGASNRWVQNFFIHTKGVFVCQGYLAGNRETISFRSAASNEAGCVAAAGDYAFSSGWKERGRVFVNRLSDGAPIGVFDPGPKVGGVENTGWIDILTGISAYKRANGEYLVFVEEDYKAKVLLYRVEAEIAMRSKSNPKPKIQGLQSPWGNALRSTRQAPIPP